MSEELSLEQDGDVGIDWMSPDRDFLSLSLAESGRLTYAVVMADGPHKSGVVQLPPEAFTVLRKLVSEG